MRSPVRLASARGAFLRVFPQPLLLGPRHQQTGRESASAPVSARTVADELTLRAETHVPRGRRRCARSSIHASVVRWSNRTAPPARLTPPRAAASCETELRIGRARPVVPGHRSHPTTDCRGDEQQIAGGVEAAAFPFPPRCPRPNRHLAVRRPVRWPARVAAPRSSDLLATRSARRRRSARPRDLPAR